jgi:hypothetical protein
MTDSESNSFSGHEIPIKTSIGHRRDWGGEGGGAKLTMGNVIFLSKRKANWIDHILRRNCFLQQVIEGKIKGEIEVIGRRGRRRRELLDDLKERRGYSLLKE